MSIKITFVGAGSTIFLKNVLGDILLQKDIQCCTISLYDIDKVRLDDSYRIAIALNKHLANGLATIETYLGTEQRKEALKSANYVINMVQIGGYEPSTVLDFDIPKKYGIEQTIGDTLGIGGIFRGLRTAPFLKDLAKEMNEVCKDALVLNYANPMAIVTGLLHHYANTKNVGLCHSVQICAKDLVKRLEIEVKDLRWEIAGINHMSWLLSIHDGKKDLYPEIKKRAIEKNSHFLAEGKTHDDMVRFEIMKHFGYYVTESSEHNAEYSPYWIKPNKPHLVKQYGIPLDEYPRRCVNQIESWKEQRETLLTDATLNHEHSHEYASSIIEAHVTGHPTIIHGNVVNNGCIENFPKSTIVEVPCVVDHTGFHPIHVGSLPIQCAALNMTNILVQQLVLSAAIEEKKEYIYQAAMLDPHTASILSLDEIVSLCDELLEAHAQWLPIYT